MHDGFSEVLHILVGLLHLRDDGFGSGVVARRLTSEVVATHLTIGEAHGEIGIAVVRKVFFHAQLGSAEIAFLQVNAVVGLDKVGPQFAETLDEVDAEFHARILGVALLVDVEFATLLHDLRLLVEEVHISRVVVVELVVDGVVEIRQIACVDMLLVVLQQGGKYLAVEGLVPCVAVVLKLYVLLLGLCLGTLHFHTATQTHRTRAELIGVAERLHPIHEGTAVLQTVGIHASHIVEVQLVLQITRRILPLADACLVFLLLGDNADGIDTFVHTDGVLPVVRRLSVLRVVLDAYGLVGTHVANHDVLLHTTHLSAGGVVGIAHLTNTIAREITLGGTRIADGHCEIAILIALHTHLCPTLRVVGHVVL